MSFNPGDARRAPPIHSLKLEDVESTRLNEVDELEMFDRLRKAKPKLRHEDFNAEWERSNQRRRKKGYH